jgi:hypothetical protein
MSEPHVLVLSKEKNPERELDKVLLFTSRFVDEKINSSLCIYERVMEHLYTTHNEFVRILMEVPADGLLVVLVDDMLVAFGVHIWTEMFFP